MKKMVIVTTVPQTINLILKGQPQFLSKIYDVTVITSHGSGFEDISRREGVEVVPVSMERGVSPLRDVFSILKMYLVLLKLRPDAIHSYTPKAGLVAMVAAKLARVPVRLHTFTGLIFPSKTGYKKNILLLVDRLIAKCATKVIPESEGVKKDLISAKVTGDDISVIGWGNIAGVDLDYFSLSAPQGGEGGLLRGVSSGNRQTFKFLYVGRLNRDKGIAELVKAFNQVEGKAELYLVGGIDSRPEDILLDEIKANPNIHLMGFQEDVRPYIARCDVLVLPSYREGFPNVILQAFAMATPVIATDISGCNEVVENGVNGWVVPARNVQALLTAMNEAVRASPNDLNAFGMRGHATVKQRFARQVYLEHLLLFYSQNI